MLLLKFGKKILVYSMIKRVTIFCASSIRIDAQYIDEAYKLGKLLAAAGIELIYGGGKVGLMGAVSSGALDSGGKVIGVIPEFMRDLELGREDINELRIVKDMHKRVEMLIEDSDMLIALPGGVGTFDELMQSIAWKTLGLIIKPIIIVNSNNFFEHILKSLIHAEEEGFMHVENKYLWSSLAASTDVLAYIEKINKLSVSNQIKVEKLW